MEVFYFLVFSFMTQAPNERRRARTIGSTGGIAKQSSLNNESSYLPILQLEEEGQSGERGHTRSLFLLLRIGLLLGI